MMGAKDIIAVAQWLKQLVSRKERRDIWATKEAERQAQILDWLYTLREHYRSQADEPHERPDMSVLDAKTHLARLRLWNEYRYPRRVVAPGGQELPRHEANAQHMQILIYLVEWIGWRGARRQLGGPRTKKDFQLANRKERVLNFLEGLPVFDWLLKNRKTRFPGYWDERRVPRYDVLDQRMERFRRKAE
ncbi:MAG: hypothetical protein OXG27_03000 [Chloroflexi bacterium]|nr:hypothetical protein [Chloroflexota bacterium]